MDSKNIQQQQEDILKSLKEIIPQNGLLFSEKNDFNEVFCKPVIMPLKSLSLIKLEQKEQELKQQQKEQ